MDWFVSVVKCFVCMVHLMSEGTCVVLTLLPLESLTFMERMMTQQKSFMERMMTQLENM